MKSTVLKTLFSLKIFVYIWGCIFVVVFCVVLTWEQAVKGLIDLIRWRSHLSTTEARLLFLLIELSSESFAKLLVHHSILLQISRTHSFRTAISLECFTSLGVWDFAAMPYWLLVGSKCRPDKLNVCLWHILETYILMFTFPFF